MEERIKELLTAESQSIFGQEMHEKHFQFQQTKREFEGDITLVLFPFIKLLKMQPQELGEKIGAELKARLTEIKSYHTVGGFLNISFSDDYWIEVLNKINQNPKYGFSATDNGRTIMVEYASPNTNKPLHLGHLRNIFLGYSVAHILKANGSKVVKTQVINDRGIHICKSMLAWERFAPENEKGERETPLTTGLKGDKFVGKYYVLFDQNLNAEANTLLEEWNKNNFQELDLMVREEVLKLLKIRSEKNDEDSIKTIDSKLKELAKNNTSLMRDAQKMLVRWEARDPQVYHLWSVMNAWVYDGFEQTYALMGVDFDHNYYESDTFLLGKDLVMEGLQKGVFYKREDGSVWIDLREDGMDEKLVLRADGTAVYITQDIGTAVDRYKDYPDLDGIIYTVGNEQDYHFKVLFLILDKLGYSWAKNCFHLSYGMVDLPSGKMKSREGTVVDADDLMAEVIDEAQKMTQERGHIEGMTTAEKEKLFKLIGLGGLKYYLLKVDPKKRMQYNPEESIELNGNTGPFIQYAHARIQSLLAKAGEFSLNPDVTIAKDEKDLIRQLALFPVVISEAAENYSPSIVANYCYELVKQYNSFYQNVPVMQEENESLRNLRLVLNSNVGKVIKHGMSLLGIDVPDKM